MILNYGKNIQKCEKCQIHFEGKDLYRGMCRECVAEGLDVHDCKGDKCEVCSFVNYEEEPIEDDNVETHQEMNLNEEITH
jgi:hypothetical protein